MHSCILDIPNPVQSQVGIPLAQKHGPYGDSFSRDVTEGELNLSNVIDESRHRQHIKSAKGSFLMNETKYLNNGISEVRAKCSDRASALWVIMISVN
jgi:hypothetical protein